MAGVTLTDPEIAELARQAVDSVAPDLPVHIAPAANDDPYRWGSAGWTVTVGADRRVQVWVPAEAAPGWVVEEIAVRLRADQQ